MIVYMYILLTRKSVCEGFFFFFILTVLILDLIK